MWLPAALNVDNLCHHKVILVRSPWHLNISSSETFLPPPLPMLYRSRSMDSLTANIAEVSLQEKPDFWGNYSDLYHTLGTIEIQSIEAAILARRLGQFQKAREILDLELPPSHILPVLALEKSNLETRVNHERTCHEVLVLALSSQSQWRETSGREVQLLSLRSVESRLEAYGSARAALQAARGIRDEWDDLPMEHWTDVEVSRSLIES
jgi:hypothetical protein